MINSMINSINSIKICILMIILINRNPNEHHKQDSVLVASKERNRFRSIVWDEYDPVHQKYLEIGK